MKVVHASQYDSNDYTFFQKTQTIIQCSCILLILLFIALVVQWQNQEILLGRNISISFLIMWVFFFCCSPHLDPLLFTFVFFLFAYASLICSAEYKHIHLNVYTGIVVLSWYIFAKNENKSKISKFLFVILFLTSCAVVAVILLRFFVNTMYDIKLDLAVLILVLLNVILLYIFCAESS